jgi:hypothetical protein
MPLRIRESLAGHKCVALRERGWEGYSER